MRYYEIAPLGIIRKDAAYFTYSSEALLAVGTIVSIPVGTKTYTGIIISIVEKPAYPTKAITQTIEHRPIPHQLVSLSLWMADYYDAHLGTVLQTVLPSGLTKKRRLREPAATSIPIRERTHFLLNKDQVAAVSTIRSASPGTVILHGVTGSGKTAVYIELAREVIAQGKSVIILVPEIGLTAQMTDTLRQHFDSLILTHSKQTESERHQLWREILTHDQPSVIVGPRSALFMPVKSLGLIVIDEAHEVSFKQEQSPRYSALRAASKLAQLHEARLVLGSATPPVSEFYLAQQTNRPIVSLPTPAQTVRKPSVISVDMTKRQHFTKHRFFSDTLIETIKQTLAANKQVLIFHNRRGSASTTHCSNCGWQAGCPRCFVPLTLHIDHHELRCHICGFSSVIPTSCPTCGGVDIVHKGIGTKLVESELKKLFPDHAMMRFDADTSTESSLERSYEKLYSGEIKLIVGTQVIAKGLDLPHLKAVGIIQADAGLSLPDYSSSERTFQLIAQAVGRVGRNDQDTTVVVQSYQPTHPAIVSGTMQDYATFYDHTLKERKRGAFPPYRFLLKLTCSYKTEATAIRHATTLAKTIREHVSTSVVILGPAPAFYERQRDSYRWQLVIKSPTRQALLDVLRYMPPTHWQADIDPTSLL